MGTLISRTVLAAALLVCGLALVARGSSYGPQPSVTGVPAHGELLAEMTCTTCHATSPLNPDALGVLRLDGLPERWEAGRRYPLVLRVEHPGADRMRWGFELTAVDAQTLEGVGRLEIEDPEATQRIDGGPAGRQYLAHTELGSAFGTSGGAAWRFAWVAPAAGDATVAFFAAANAANGDGAKEGDFIYSPAPRPLATVAGPPSGGAGAR